MKMHTTKKTNLKKLLCLLCLALLVAGLLAGCAPSKQEEAAATAIGGLKGPTSMGMVKLFDDIDNGTSAGSYTYQIAVSADELTPLLLNGSLDIMAAPLNLGSIIYNNTDGGVQLVAVTTLGVIYIVEKGEQTVFSVEDLQGKTIYATGKGSTPEYALRYLLNQYGVDEDSVVIEWKSEPTEIVALMANEEHAIAMMPQPFVTVAQNQLADLNIALDLTEQWNNLHNGSQLITAGLFVRSDFAEQNPEQLAAFLADYQASLEYVNGNVADAALLVEQYDIVKAAIAEKAIPYCNLVFITGAEMHEAAKGYLQTLYDQNPKAIGGSLPGEDFYYEQ